MKKMKTVSHIYNSEIIESLTCDVCKKVCKCGKWTLDFYNIMEVEVKMTVGYRYPEGGSGEETSFDICPECFTEKLIPVLKEMGAEPTVKEIDWD